MASAAHAAEAAGFESAWVAETRIARDAVTAVTAILARTERLRVGSAAVNVFTRGAALTAVTWATLAEAFPGRAVLGLGVGSESTLRQQGYVVDHPVGRLREFTEAVRAAWEGPAPVSYAGRYVRFDALEPELLPDPAPCLYLCVGGPQTLRLAGRIADGVVLDTFLPVPAVAAALGHVGEDFAGEAAAALVVSVADTVDEAAARLRPTLARYLVRFPELARVSGLDEEYVARLQRRAVEGGLEAVAADVPTELVARCAVCGPPARCHERIGEYRAAGIALPILFTERESLGAMSALAG